MKIDLFKLNNLGKTTISGEVVFTKDMFGTMDIIDIKNVFVDGELEIDPNCAVGVLEEFKKKYPDYNVTATFFVNGGIFEQEEYNEKILK